MEWRPVADRRGIWLTLLVIAACAACNGEEEGRPTVFVPDTSEVVTCEGQYCDATRLQRYDLDGFYQKVTETHQIAIAGSHRVDDRGLEVAREIVSMMLSGNERIPPMLVEAEAHIGVIAEAEATTDIPEHRFLKNDPNTNWDARARGFGGTPEVPVTTTGEENLLCRSTDRWLGESILVHEFAHTLHLIAINGFDAGFQSELDSIFAEAQSEDLWADTYANTNSTEYFAEGVQSWFNANQSPQPGIHNSVDTKAELAEYDPRLHDLIGRYFIDTDWSPSCPSGA